VRSTSGLEGEASLASEDFAGTVAIKGSGARPADLGRLVFVAAMQAGLRERSLYRKQIAARPLDGDARKWASNAAMVVRMKTRVRLATLDQYFVTVFNTNVNNVVEIIQSAKAKLLATVSVQHSAPIQVRIRGVLSG
jgi:hypothetical protein